MACNFFLQGLFLAGGITYQTVHASVGLKLGWLPDIFFSNNQHTIQAK